MSEGRLVSTRRKQIAAWAVENFGTWPKPMEVPDADPESIGCELVVLSAHELPVLRCRMGGGYIDSLTWFYAKRSKKRRISEDKNEFYSWHRYIVQPEKEHPHE